MTSASPASNASSVSRRASSGSNPSSLYVGIRTIVRPSASSRARYTFSCWFPLAKMRSRCGSAKTGFTELTARHGYLQRRQVRAREVTGEVGGREREVSVAQLHTRSISAPQWVCLRAFDLKLVRNRTVTRL